jgi:UDP-glucose 4-epimerase
MTTILINGIADQWGALLAQRLSRRAELRLLGLDTRMPALDTGRAELLTLPMRGDQIAALLRQEQVEVVVQVALVGELARVPREAAKRANVIGTLELLGACLHSKVRHAVVRSSTLVYGPDSAHPAFIGEERALDARHTTPWLRDLAEMEQVIARFSARHTRPTISVLRLAQTLGGGLRSAFGERLTQPPLLRPPGYDPRVQLLHGDDGLAALEHAVDHPLPGPINIAADPPLPLSRALRLAAGERSPFELLGTMFERLGARAALPALDGEFLRYDCVGDTARMRAEFGFSPTHDAEATASQLALRPHEEPA